MKKIIGILFIIGALLLLADFNNISIFIMTKIVGLILLIPAFMTYKFEE